MRTGTVTERAFMKTQNDEKIEKFLGSLPKDIQKDAFDALSKSQQDAYDRAAGKEKSIFCGTPLKKVAERTHEFKTTMSEAEMVAELKRTEVTGEAPALAPTTGGKDMDEVSACMLRTLAFVTLVAMPVSNIDQKLREIFEPLKETKDKPTIAQAREIESTIRSYIDTCTKGIENYKRAMQNV